MRTLISVHSRLACFRRFRGQPAQKGDTSMKIAQAFMIGSAALAASLFVLPVHAAEQHLVFSPDKIQWGPAPDALPKGAEAALLYGDPTKEGQFALRLRLPSGYHVPPHSHPVDQNNTVGPWGLADVNPKDDPRKRM